MNEKRTRINDSILIIHKTSKDDHYFNKKAKYEHPWYTGGATKKR